MTRPKVQIGDDIRDMNDAEFAQYQIDVEASQAEAALATQRATDKAALLTRLGITDDEAKLLLG
jgi:hypothetical protein